MEGQIFESGDQQVWKVWGREVSRSALVFFFQITILYISIITCFANLTLKNGPSELWIALLSLSLGSILPSPKVKKTSGVSPASVQDSTTPSLA